jgi:hypothetical protein
MRLYIITSGLIFALITVAHIARLATEPMNLLHEPIFVVLTILGQFCRSGLSSCCAEWNTDCSSNC